MQHHTSPLARDSIESFWRQNGLLVDKKAEQNELTRVVGKGGHQGRF